MSNKNEDDPETHGGCSLIGMSAPIAACLDGRS